MSAGDVSTAVVWGDESSDAELITAARGGSSEAFGALYERHSAAARTVARQYTRSSADAEDVVSDAFARVYAIVRGGGGPDVAFRAYLFTVVRRLAHARVEAGRRVQPTDDMATFEAAFGSVSGVDDPALAGFERGVVAKAYSALPERWQAVLWYTEIERLPPAQVAPLLGLTANGVAALAYRAREGLREAYLQQHLVAAPSETCRTVNGKLGSYVRGGLARRETATVRTHLESCEACRGLVLELGDVNHGLRGIIAPLVLGVAGLGALASPLPVGVLASVGIGGGAAVSGGAAVGTGAGATGASVGTGATAGAGAGASVGAGTGATAGGATSLATAGGAAGAAGTSGAAGSAVAGGAGTALAGTTVTGGVTGGAVAGTAASGTVASGTVAAGTVAAGTAAAGTAAAGTTAATVAGATAAGATTAGATAATAAGATVAGATAATAATAAGAVGAGSLVGAGAAGLAGATAAGAVTGATVAGATGAAAVAGGATALVGAGAAASGAVAAGGIGGLIAAIPGGLATAVTAGVVGVSLAVGGALAPDETRMAGPSTSSGPEVVTPPPSDDPTDSAADDPAPDTGTGSVFDSPALDLPAAPAEAVAPSPAASPDADRLPVADPVRPSGSAGEPAGTDDSDPVDAPPARASAPVPPPAQPTVAALGASAPGGTIDLVPGESTTVTIVLVNTGETGVTDLRAALLLPDGVVLTGSAGAGPGGDRWSPCTDDGSVFCLPSLPGGASSVLAAVVQVRPDAPASASTAVSVQVTGPGGAAFPVRSVAATVRTPADVVLGAWDPVTLVAGIPADVSFVVQNVGGSPARDVVATVGLPTGVRWVGTSTGSWTCTGDGSVVTCRLEGLPAGASVEGPALTLVADDVAAALPGLALEVTVAEAGGTPVVRSLPLGVTQGNAADLTIDPPPTDPPADAPAPTAGD